MSLNKILLIAGAAAVAMAAEPLEARDMDTCMSAVQEAAAIITEMPQPPSAVVEVLEAMATATASLASCEIPAVTGPAGPAYTSYLSGIMSFYTAHSSQLMEIVSACTDVPEVASQIASMPTDVATCSEITWADSGSSSDDSSSDEESAASTPTPTPSADTTPNAAPRVTGAAVAAVAMAGLFAAQAF
jgi:hypothetical protein